MPEITKYLQRVSFLLRQGKPANDVAVYLPTDDAWSGFMAGKDSVNQSMAALLPPDLIPHILDAGYNFDLVDDRAIEQVGIPYPVVVLPPVKRMPPGTSHKLEEFKNKGGTVVESSRLAELPGLYTPDFAAGNPAIGFIHRKTEDADIYFIANTSNQAIRGTAQARARGRHAEWWDPFNGRVSPARDNPIQLDLQPYESRVLVFSDRTANRVPKTLPHVRDVLDLSSGWTVTFPGIAQPVGMATLRSWAADENTKFFSGQAVYEKVIQIPAPLSKPGLELWLDFGSATPIEPAASRAPGMRAWLESPVREAAKVWVNDQAAGAVWRPPYQVEVSKLLHAGENKIRIVVGNLAINELAGQALPDYKLLNLRFGERFTPQDMQDLRPLPSGLLGPIHLRTLER
jgi:hypothetical protein